MSGGAPKGSRMATLQKQQVFILNSWRFEEIVVQKLKIDFCENV